MPGPCPRALSVPRSLSGATQDRRPPSPRLKAAAAPSPCSGMGQFSPHSGAADVREEHRACGVCNRAAGTRGDSVIVNTARGAVLDEEALADVLEGGRIFAAGIDVYSDEPRVPQRALLHVLYAVLLPHIGSVTLATRLRIALMATTGVAAALGGS